MNSTGFVCNAGPTRVHVTCSTGQKRGTDRRSSLCGQKFDTRVYLVTDRKVGVGKTVEDVVRDAVKGAGERRGVTFVQ